MSSINRCGLISTVCRGMSSAATTLKNWLGHVVTRLFCCRTKVENVAQKRFNGTSSTSTSKPATTDRSVSPPASVSEPIASSAAATARAAVPVLTDSAGSTSIDVDVVAVAELKEKASRPRLAIVEKVDPGLKELNREYMYFCTSAVPPLTFSEGEIQNIRIEASVPYKGTLTGDEPIARLAVIYARGLTVAWNKNHSDFMDLNMAVLGLDQGFSVEESAEALNIALKDFRFKPDDKITIHFVDETQLAHFMVRIS